MQEEVQLQTETEIKFLPKIALLDGAYYTIAEITDRKSPSYIASSATIFRALRKGELTANHIGRKTLIKGSAIHQWIQGR